MIIRLDSLQKTPSKDLGKGQLTIFLSIVLQTNYNFYTSWGTKRTTKRQYGDFSTKTQELISSVSLLRQLSLIS